MARKLGERIEAGLSVFVVLADHRDLFGRRRGRRRRNNIRCVYDYTVVKKVVVEIVHLVLSGKEDGSLKNRLRHPGCARDRREEEIAL
jgi:hypothetical protein